MKNLFIHGWSFSNLIWKDFYNRKNFDFIDLPYHGENKHYPYSKNIIENFVNVITEKYKYENNLNLVGWSLGASISVLIALKIPKKINKLILIGFSPKFMDNELGHNPIAVKAFLFALNKSFDITIYNFRKNATGSIYKDIPLPEKKGSIKFLKEFINLDLRYSLKKINIETILIHGKQDKIINPKGSIYSSNVIKNAKLELLEGNHAPFIENKDCILKYID